jgi:1-acyl-sn-glycerol-3-phosphate acyltransferase
VAASLPLTLPLAALFDGLLRTRWAACRALAFALGYLAAEAVGLLASFAVWLAAGPWLGARERFDAANFRLQVVWARALLAIARRVYGLTLELDLAEPARRPALVLVRHASLVDALLPTVFVSAREGRRLRFVLKRELLLDPCLDVVGQRLPNAFVARGGDEPAREEASIRRLAENLGPEDGVVIFPEGTRFTPRRLEAALARIRASGDAARSGRVAGLRHVLPLRSRGLLALLEAAPQADLLFLAHQGLEGTSHARAVLRGGLIGRRIRVRTWRVPVSHLPADRADRLAWLDAEWARIDAWIDAGERAPARGGLG